MNLSMIEVINLLSTSFSNLNIDDINFILTVIRDNSTLIETYEYINKLLNFIKE